MFGLAAEALLRLFSIFLSISLILAIGIKIIWFWFTEPKGTEWRNFPEFDQIATVMSVPLASRKRFGLARIDGVARTNPIRRQIIFNMKSFLSLSAGEKLAVVAHELAHLKAHHSLLAVLIATSGAIVALFFTLTPWPTLSIPIWIISLLAMLLFRRSSEYHADLLAARFVDPNLLISGLRKVTRETHLSSIDLLHPTPTQRIAKLMQKNT